MTPVAGNHHHDYISLLTSPNSGIQQMLKTTNPLLDDWSANRGIPPFESIQFDHYRPAFDAALTENQSENDAIADNPEAPTFQNTIEALELSGKRLSQVSGVFHNLNSADTNDEMQTLQREISPILTEHRNKMLLNEALFGRIDRLMSEREDLDLTAEQDRVLERYHTMFVRAGARLDGTERLRIDEITQRLSTLGTQFSQNVLADESAYELVLETEEELAGLPEFVRTAAARAAEDRGKPGKFVITLSRSSIEPFLQFSERRDLREQAFIAWSKRGENGGETDNREIIGETIDLRSERAQLLGFESFAAFKLDDQMAQTPNAVRGLLDEVWQPARARAEAECKKLQNRAQAEGGNFKIEPWDWRFYAEKVRKQEFDIGEEEIKPYLQLDKMIEAVFDTAHRLFGVSITELDNVPVYHPDVRAFEIIGGNGEPVGLFFGDYFARPSKRSGAWMSAFRRQRKLGEDVRPIIVNVMNFSQGAAGEATLLTFDDARTLFHEFGHALHGLLSDVTYPMISGTSVSRDFVELPSQLYEHWLSQPEVLGKFAVHYQTGEAMPKELLDRLLAAENFNQGFATVEYVASAMVDLEVHSHAAADISDDGEPFDISAFEESVLSKIDMPEQILMRHRSPHFLHVFSGDGYSAGYYSYLWAEVMDADAFGAFEEAGDVFDPETAARLAESIYSTGGRDDPADAYRAFRGRQPTTAALLEKRGLSGEG